MDREDGSRQPTIGRRTFLTGAIGALGLLPVLRPAVTLGARRRRLYIDRFFERGDADWTQPIRRALHAARANGGLVLGTPGRVYSVTPQATSQPLEPWGDRPLYPVCVQIPAGVTLDMQGATLQLGGQTQATLVTNGNPTGTDPRDLDVGFVNAILDGANVKSKPAPLMQLAYIDRLTLSGVKIINGVYQGGMVYNCRTSVFDDLAVDGFVGQPWLFGSPSGANNQIYDSQFGTLDARNVVPDPVALDSALYSQGNSVIFVLTRCTIQSVAAYYCTAGIKIQFPSDDVLVGTVRTAHCGNVSGNCGLKIQGEPGNAVSRVRVAKVIAESQTGPGLYMDLSQDCTVDSFEGLGNVTTDGRADVWIGGTNDHVKHIRSDASGGPGVLVRPYATGYRLNNIWVRNPNRQVPPVLTAAVKIYGGSGRLGSVTCLETESSDQMRWGVWVNSPEAVGSIDELRVQGASGDAFLSDSQRFSPPPPPTRPR